ncbi:MAG: hypothetical protein N3G19_02955, partial [Candidatus Pacearchaeota archaeon]|nr:hypothetical protein [Candidatus Pacearchaeota archaeon]
MIKISQTTILAFLVFIILGSTLISAVTYNKEQLKEGQLIREHLIKSDVAIASYDEISGEIVITAISDGNIAIDEKIYSVSSGTKINIHSDNSKTIILKQSFNDGYASLFNLVNQKLKISNESKYSIQFNTYVLRNLKKIYLTRDIKTKELNGFVISATDNNTQTINFVEIILDEDDKLTLNKGQPIINKESALRIGNSIIEAHENVVLLSSKDKDGNIEYQIQGKSFSIDDKTFSGKVFTTPKLNSFFVRGKFEDETNGISFDSSQNPVGINIIYGETGAPLLENEIRITEEDYGTIITSYGKPYNVKFKVGDEEYKGNNAIIIANDGLGRVLIDNGGELKKGAITLKQENGLKLLKSDLRELENIATTPTVLFSKDTKGFINENGELVLQKKGKSNTVAIATFDRVQTRVSEMPNIVEDIKNEKWESLSNRLALLELENPAEYEKVESILKESFGQDFVDVIKKEKLESQDLDELSLMKANFQPTEAASLAVNIAREKGISWQAMVASPFAKGLAGPAFYATRFIPEERLIHDTLKRTDLNDEDKKQLLADNLPKEYLIQRFKLMGGIGVSNVEEARRQKIGFEEGPMGFLARGATEEFDFYKDVMNKAGYDDNFLDNLLKQNADEEMMMVASMAVPLGIMKSPAGIAAKTVLNSADDATRLAASMSDDWATKTTSAPITFELSAPLEARKPIIIEFNERVPKMVKKTIYEEGKTIEIFDPVYTSSGKPIVEK